MSKRYIITPKNPKEFHAGPKAKEDIAYFLAKEDYQSLFIPVDIPKWQKLFYSFILKRQLNAIQQGDVVVIQYPMKSYFISNVLLRYLNQKKANIICVIHDIESLRQNDAERIKRDIQVFNQCTSLIVHTKEMENWLKQQGCHRPMTQLYLFDYYKGDNSDLSSIKPKHPIVFAGNLNKSLFLKGCNFPLDVFGPCDYQAKLPSHIAYQGSYEPDQLPNLLKEYQFGLVWDGMTTDNISGDVGHYLKYNAPHKTSLYLVAGLPVIIWEKAAMANYIKEHQLGMTIRSLDDIEEKIKQCDYEKLKHNVMSLQQKLQSGEMIHSSLIAAKNKVE